MTAIALTIAGSDSGGGAGIQADLKTFSALGVFGASVITALTAQNTQGVSAIHAVPPDFVKAQLEAIFADIKVGAVKIGMISDPAVIKVVAACLRQQNELAVILDPVMVATSGDTLVSREAVSGLVTNLFPHATLITPNLIEAATLTQTPEAETVEEMKEQADHLVKMGANAVLIKGGHSDQAECLDLFFDGEVSKTFVAPRINTSNTHGTGCTLSSAIAAEIAKGLSLEAAISEAKTYVTEAIRNSDRLDIGKGNGPTHHFHAWWD